MLCKGFVYPQSPRLNSASGFAPPPGALQGLTLLPCVSVCVPSGPCGASAPRYLLGPQVQLCFGLGESTGTPSCVLAICTEGLRDAYTTASRQASGKHGISRTGVVSFTLQRFLIVRYSHTAAVASLRAQIQCAGVVKRLDNIPVSGCLRSCWTRPCQDSTRVLARCAATGGSRQQTRLPVQS